MVCKYGMRIILGRNGFEGVGAGGCWWVLEGEGFGAMSIVGSARGSRFRSDKANRFRVVADRPS